MERRGREDRRQSAVTVLLLALALTPAAGFAALGRQAESTDVDQKMLHARKSRTVRSQDLVVHSTGSARFFTGFAYIPSLMPRSVREEDIR